MKFVKFRERNGYYRPIDRDDPYLLTIGSLITDLGTSAEWLVKDLTDSALQSLSTNFYYLDLKDNKVIIEPLYSEEPEKYRKEIDKDVLLRLAITWQELVDKKAEEITIVQENGEIKMIGKLPESS